jgi:hypothetical protein
MTNVARWALGWVGVSKKAAAKDAPAEVANKMVELNRVLQIQVLKPAGTELKIFTQEMNQRSLIFRSTTRFEVGEELNMVMLLRMDCRLELKGKVQWTHDGQRGNTGQIDFQLSPAQEALLLTYLSLRSR